MAHKLMHAQGAGHKLMHPVLERDDVLPVAGMPHVFNELGSYMVWNSTVPWRRVEPEEFAPIMIFNKQLDFVHKIFNKFDGPYSGKKQPVEKGSQY
ncbi:hypothetical protein EMIHUDRAFT_421297 [Emiliania huxleyi CCMP1516]|uniref:Uncharacterized protein n=2 Tax=Emiliania huxleyi TaxID=2903 RepID=A0A0D3JU99_EMIH1|nr:hypothetical protein EMIHUDRAFT_421297 [Emiliania huxleyi CCMP1516]EOD27084.1 hypothetical protein EMIHUDRAFT_421297 [Emiliania huxleyi CCMP1516]|eukprot:XP_005779513.1 hypothetical protein EMIHUDRAFT_421297 [Emiliania huxleyi CCMP1516]